MIIPALLTNNKDELQAMLRLCARFTDYVQIDVMDGKFVPSLSIGPGDLSGVQCGIRSEAHIMSVSPLSWLDSFKKIGSEQIIYHFEIKADHPALIDKIRAYGFKVGLAVNPATEIDEFDYLVDKIDSVLFMSVNPGFYGAPFIPGVLDKIKRFRRLWNDKVVAVDGGIKLDNLKKVASCGVDHICVGSALLRAREPSSAYSEFNRVLAAVK